MGTLVAAFVLATALQESEKKAPEFKHEYFPKRADPSQQSDSGFYGDLTYEFILFVTPSFKGFFDTGTMIDLEIGYQWEFRSGVYASAGLFISPYANASKTVDLGPPAGNENTTVDFLIYGIVARLGNGMADGYHFGATGGIGMINMDLSVKSQTGATVISRSDNGLVYRVGIFLDRDIVHNETWGLILGITGDYYYSAITDAANDNISFWSVGFRLMVTFEPTSNRQRGLPPEE